jgi:hypothetical protein
MIAQVLADAFQRMADLDADALQKFRLADTGQFQKLGRIDRAGADDDLAVGACIARRLREYSQTAHPGR